MGSTKLYCIDSVNFNLEFGDVNNENFQCRFNPTYPVVSLLFGFNLWIILLPGARRQVQGQIIYQIKMHRNGPKFETCQWSPQGDYLLVLFKTQISMQNTSLVWDRDNSRVKCDYFLSGTLYQVENKKSRLTFRELIGSRGILGNTDQPSQLSSKL